MWLSSEQLRQQRQQRQQPRRSARLRDSAARSRPGPRFTLATSSGSSSSLTRPRRTATATSPGTSTRASASSAASRPDPTNESQDADVVFLAEVSSEPRCASDGGRPAADLIDLVSSDSEDSDAADSCSDETRFEEEPGYLHRQQQQWTGSNHLQDQPDDDEASLTYFTEVTSFSDSSEDDDDDDARTDTGAGDGSSSSLPLCQSQWRAGMHDADDLTPVRQEGDSGSTATPANPWTRSPLPPRWRDMALRLDDIGVATTSFKGFKALEGFSCASTSSSSRAKDHQALDNHLHRDGHQDGDDQDKQSQSLQDRLQDGDDQDEKTQSSQDRLLAEKEDDCAEIQCGQLLVWDDEVMDVDGDDHASEAPDDAGYASQDGRMCRPWSQGGGWGWSPGRGGAGIECS